MIAFWRKIFSSNAFCSNCSKELKSDSIPGICNFCLKEFSFNGLIPHKSWNNNLLEVYSPLVYEGIIKELIYKFKYDGEKLIAYTFGVIMADYLKFLKLYNKNTILVPVPLAEKREAERGFNQARLLAEVIASELKITSNHKILCRKQETPPLYNLNPGQRKMVLEGAFSFKKDCKGINKENFILVDDIFTTGSTLNEAARVMFGRGVRKVIGVTAVMAVNKEKFDKGHNV